MEMLISAVGLLISVGYVSWNITSKLNSLEVSIAEIKIMLLQVNTRMDDMEVSHKEMQNKLHTLSNRVQKLELLNDNKE